MWNGASVGRTVGGNGLGAEPGFRLAFGFLALMLLGALAVYRRVRERPREVAHVDADP